jgi:Na+/H+ antiporter NhaC
MRDFRLIVLLFLFHFLLPGATEAQLSIKPPAFALSGVKAEYSVSGLNLESDRPVQYKAVIDGQTIVSGVSLPADLQTLQLTIPNCGTGDLSITIGNQTTSTRVRCIPGWLSLLPPLIAIILALLTREVISSLFIGIWVGATFVFAYNPFFGFLRTLDKYILNALADSAHSAIVIFSICLGGMIGVINRTGGMQGIVEMISRLVRGPRTAQIATWAMGVLIFFDDYANTLIVGNSMRPVCDKNKISREKLSYLVDSTAAPIAGIAVLSTWIGYEIGLIREAYVSLGIPETNFYGVFLQTIPFRFYCILALFFAVSVAFMRRDFGPMLQAEQRAINEGKVLADTAMPISSPEAATPQLPEDMPKRWYNAAIPIAIVIIGTFVGLLGDGGMYAPHHFLSKVSIEQNNSGVELSVLSVSQETNTLAVSGENFMFARLNFDETSVFEGKTGQEAIASIKKLEEGSIIKAKLSESTMSLSEKARSAFSGADSTRVLIWVSVMGSIIAIFLGWIQKLINIETGIKAWVDGARTLIMAVMIMILAWSINGVCTDLGTAHYVVAMVTNVIPYWLLPTIIFIIACFISFSTGTSWGTMAILLPISIPLSYHLNMQHYEANIANIAGAPEMMEYLKQAILVSIGAVLEGSIFGDHCSPISDTTIMSSMASGSDHIDHVKTQAPYAALVGLVAIICCYIPAGMGISPYLTIPASMIILVGFLSMFGRDPEKVTQSA